MFNFIQTTNPFSLATPPAWFLAQLYAYDPAFVIFPSVKHAYYCTGRRGRFERGLMRPIEGAPDSAIYVQHKLWPWKPILPEGCHQRGWAGILLEIPEFDTQRFDDAGEQLDNVEEARDRAVDREIADNLKVLNADTFAAYQLMNGERVGYGARAHGGSNDKLGHKTRGSRRRAYRPVTQGQPGAIWTGR